MNASRKSLKRGADDTAGGGYGDDVDDAIDPNTFSVDSLFQNPGAIFRDGAHFLRKCVQDESYRQTIFSEVKTGGGQSHLNMIAPARHAAEHLKAQTAKAHSHGSYIVDQSTTASSMLDTGLDICEELAILADPESAEPHQYYESTIEALCDKLGVDFTHVTLESLRGALKLTSIAAIKGIQDVSVLLKLLHCLEIKGLADNGEFIQHVQQLKAAEILHDPENFGRMILHDPTMTFESTQGLVALYLGVPRCHVPPFQGLKFGVRYETDPAGIQCPWTPDAPPPPSMATPRRSHPSPNYDSPAPNQFGTPLFSMGSSHTPSGTNRRSRTPSSRRTPGRRTPARGTPGRRTPNRRNIHAYDHQMNSSMDIG